MTHLLPVSIIYYKSLKQEASLEGLAMILFALVTSLSMLFHSYYKLISVASSPASRVPSLSAEFLSTAVPSEDQFAEPQIVGHSSPSLLYLNPNYICFFKISNPYSFQNKPFINLRQNILQGKSKNFRMECLKRLKNQLTLFSQIYQNSRLFQDMNFLREIVGGPKNRYKEDGFNLDLTYITDRIIAMAFPASGIEKLYRNSIDSVSQFLTKYHNDKYITVNLSGRQIDEKKLKNVKSYFWEDHRSPNFDLLFQICYEVANFLKDDPQRVAVFHCNHGKGRTGTIICCFFLFTGAFKFPKQALHFYAEKRFEQAEGYGVTQPAQIKYIEYFCETLNKILYPRVVAIKSIVFKSEDLEVSPYFKVRNVSDKSIILKSKDKNLNVFEIKKNNQLTIRINESIYFAGDAVLELKKQNTIGNIVLGNYMFNTAFLDPTKIQKVTLKNLTPLSAQKSGNLPEDFVIEIQFKSICECESVIPIQDRCSKCKSKLVPQAERWKLIQLAVKSHKMLCDKGAEIAFGNTLPEKSQRSFTGPIL